MRGNKGFSLIEVMTTLVLGMVVMLMVVQLFVNAKNNHAQNDRISETLESGRYALRQIATDLRQTGFVGGVIDPNNVSTDASLAAPTTDCGKSGEANWAYNLVKYRALQYDDKPADNTNHVCVPTTFLNGTDILAVKRVSTNVTALSKDNVYLRSDFNSACLWYYDGTNTPGASCPATGTTDWLYMARVYYIRNNTDNIPTLCRESLGAGPTMSELCLAEGIEQFHVMFGIDTDATQDGIANKFVSDPATETGLTDWSARVVSARIYVLARAIQQDTKFKNTKTYTLGDRSVTVNDNYYRRLYSTTVMLRNPTYAAAFQ